jgi:sialic acid synthase SpsE
MRRIKIENRFIGENEPCFVIAEAGSNHDGKIAQAKRLVDAAVDAGADAVKFQVFKAEKLYSSKTPVMNYLKKDKLIKQGETVVDLMKKLEMPRGWIRILSRYCRKKKIIFLATPFDLAAVDELEEYVPAYKIASFEITHLPLLKYTAKKKKPIILSTGMADLSDVRLALDTIFRQGNKNVILLHCDIGYPVRYEDLNLRAMQTLKRIFRVPTGFSDHTLGITSDIVSVALGACVIEKHFTLSRRLKGPDHPFALEPAELKSMVEEIKNTEKALGSPQKKHTASERELYRLARRSLVAACDIPKGTKITEGMLDVKRPGYGIHPKMMKMVVGKKARRNIEEDDILVRDMI